MQKKNLQMYFGDISGPWWSAFLFHQYTLTYPSTDFGLPKLLRVFSDSAGFEGVDKLQNLPRVDFAKVAKFAPSAIRNKAMPFLMVK